MKKKRKYIYYVEDRLVTPYVIWEHLPTKVKYVEFPLANNPSIFSPYFNNIEDYQQKRYYLDERPMKLEDFNKLCLNMESIQVK